MNESARTADKTLAYPATPPSADPAARLPSWHEERMRQKQRLSRIRRAVLRGEYENALKVSVAADRVLEAIFPTAPK